VGPWRYFDRRNFPKVIWLLGKSEKQKKSKIVKIDLQVILSTFLRNLEEMNLAGFFR
jgi:hypothetical protein